MIATGHHQAASPPIRVRIDERIFFVFHYLGDPGIKFVSVINRHPANGHLRQVITTLKAGVLMIRRITAVRIIGDHIAAGLQIFIADQVNEIGRDFPVFIGRYYI